MPRPPEFWDQVKNVFDPSEVLTGNRGEQFYCEREHSPLQRMLKDFERDPTRKNPVRGFLIGHLGSGKSSILLRFLKEQSTQYMILYFDVGQNLDLSQTNQIDILFLLGAAIFKNGQEQGANPDKLLLKELRNSIFRSTIEQHQTVRDEQFDVMELTKTVLCAGAELVGSTYGGKLVETALKPFQKSVGNTETIARRREIEPQIQNIITNVNLIVAEVETKLNRPFLVVVDGLDKLEKEEQVDLIFGQSQALKGPLCNLIYTAPMHLSTFNKIREGCHSYLVPNIKLFDKTSITPNYVEHSKGYQTLTNIVTSRLATIPLLSSEIFEVDILKLMIRKSGGLLRLFIKLISDACTQAEILGIEKINREAAQLAIDEETIHFAGGLDQDQIKELQEVHRTKIKPATETGKELLQQRFIVAYRDGGDLWYDAHPLTWDKL